MILSFNAHYIMKTKFTTLILFINTYECSIRYTDLFWGILENLFSCRNNLKLQQSVVQDIFGDETSLIHI